MYIKTFAAKDEDLERAIHQAESAAQHLLNDLSGDNLISVTAQTLEGDMYTHVITVVYE